MLPSMGNRILEFRGGVNDNLCMNPNHAARLIPELRKRTGIDPDQCSDTKLLFVTEGTLCRFGAELALLWESFSAPFRRLLRKRELWQSTIEYDSGPPELWYHPSSKSCFENLPTIGESHEGRMVIGVKYWRIDS